MPERPLYVDPLVELIPGLVEPGAAVLDCGFGRGQHAVFLAGSGLTVDAFDQPGPDIERMRRFATDNAVPINFFAADLETHEPEPARYDVVLASKVIHLLTPASARRLIARLRIATAPGGIAVIITFADSARMREAFPDSVAANTYVDADGLRAWFPGWDVVRETSEDLELGQRAPDGSAVVAHKVGLIARRPG